MRELNFNEVESVNGGNPAVYVAIVVAVIAAGYTLGKDAAERDNRHDKN